MGYNTSILLLNDAAGYIRDNAQQFADNAYAMMIGDIKRSTGEVLKPGDSLAVGNHGNPMRLIHRSHADEVATVILGKNISVTLNTRHTAPYDSIRDTDVQVVLLKEAAKKLGYNLHKIPGR